MSYADWVTGIQRTDTKELILTLFLLLLEILIDYRYIYREWMWSSGLGRWT